MATGDKLVNLDELKLVYDKLHVPSVQVQIPTGQWSGSSTRTYTVNATNVTADTIIDWAMDSSINYLKEDLTVTPGSGTIQFSTTAIPAGTINVTLFFPGVKGEVVIQTLADVYSKSQVDQIVSQSTASLGIVSALPNVSSMPNGIVGFALSQAVTLDNQTLSAGTRFIGYCYNQIAHFVSIPNGSIIRTIRVDGNNNWTILQSTANLIEIRSATCTIASIGANNTADVDCVLSSAFTNNPKNYILISISSTTLMPLVIRSWSDSTHFNCRIAQLANAAASNVNLTFRVIGVSVSAT